VNHGRALWLGGSVKLWIGGEPREVILVVVEVVEL